MLAQLVAVLVSQSSVPLPSIYEGEEPPKPPPWSSERARLGKRLFNDRLLSKDQTVSCASCHQPELAFTDGRTVSLGVGGKTGTRSAPAVLNRHLGQSQFWDGRAATLEIQSLLPIQNELEMNLGLEEAVKRLEADKAYPDAFKKAYDGPPTRERLADALASYERSVYSIDSPFDRFIAGDAKALSAEAQRGLKLFGDKAKCSECHTGPNFTDEQFHVLGLEGDPGRGRVTKNKTERSAFKTPTLREIARTAPYMHDGNLRTLAAVVDYYDKGGGPGAERDPKLKALKLTPQEKADLVAFLESLSGKVIDVDGAIAQRGAP
jgi:cytochrome c peroxidase